MSFSELRDKSLCSGNPGKMDPRLREDDKKARHPEYFCCHPGHFYCHPGLDPGSALRKNIVILSAKRWESRKDGSPLTRG